MRNAAFNAQGSRGIIVVVQVGAVKIYVAAMDVLRKKERQGVTPEFHSLLNANVFFCRVFFNLTLCMTKLKVLTLSFPNFMDNPNESN